MSAPQPPGDDAPTSGSGDAPASDTGEHRDAAPASYDFHGEKLDFDPYRFGAPEPTTPSWTPPVPSGAGGGGARPPAPGERWSPGGDAPPDVRPGDYWQGGGSAPQGGAVFPPPGYAPPRDSGPGDAGHAPVDLNKTAPPPGGSAYPPPGGSSYPPPDGRPPSPPGYPAPGGYPAPPQNTQRARSGNGLAVSGMVVGIVAVLLGFTSWPGIVAGMVGLGLSIGGLASARRGAPMKGLAITGIVCSIVAMVIGTVILVVYLQRIDFDCVRDAGDNFGQAQECVK